MHININNNNLRDRLKMSQKKNTWIKMFMEYLNFTQTVNLDEYHLNESKFVKNNDIIELLILYYVNYPIIHYNNNNNDNNDDNYKYIHSKLDINY